MLSSSWALMELSWMLSTVTTGNLNPEAEDWIEAAEGGADVELLLMLSAGSQDWARFIILISRSGLRSRETLRVSRMTSAAGTLDALKSMSWNATSIRLTAKSGSRLKPGGWSTRISLSLRSTRSTRMSRFNRSSSRTPSTFRPAFRLADQSFSNMRSARRKDTSSTWMVWACTTGIQGDVSSVDWFSGWGSGPGAWATISSRGLNCPFLSRMMFSESPFTATFSMTTLPLNRAHGTTSTSMLFRNSSGCGSNPGGGWMTRLDSATRPSSR